MTTTDTTTTDVTTLVEDYFALWLEPDEAARTERVAAVFTEDGRHVDPNADAKGHDALAAMITAVHAQFPGFQMRRTSGIDQHNDQVRFAWELLGPDGTPILAGLDAGEVGDDGRFRRVAGFWGALS